jgi:2',3'-cyclic-nucleotide 2'-phosphodiesterase/3'-nucleotidase
MDIKIIYTSDTHGRLTAYDFLNKNYGDFGISRLSSYLKNLNANYLLLDNGDYLQGSPLLDYTRKTNAFNPVAKIFNALKYDYINVGNHDFNYGLSHLKTFESSCNSPILCANILNSNKHFFKPYTIHELNGVKIAIIGLTTEYIPFWEKPEHISNLTFMDAVKTTKQIIKDNHLKQLSDLIVVLYHGGFDRDLKTGKLYDKATIENRGYDLFQIEDVDILLTGHQHIPQVYSKNKRVALQTSSNAKDFGVIDISIKSDGKNLIVDKIEGKIESLETYPIDQNIETLLKQELNETNKFLSKTIGSSKYDMSIKSPLSCRIKKHLIFQMINQIQLEYTQADISIASLPNETHGFKKNITLNDIAVNFPFENDLVVLEITGEILKNALEKNAEYFSIQDNKIGINPKYLFPKVEHYNYDVYDGINYTIKVGNPLGKRIKSLTINGIPIEENKTYKIALNSYRAIGSGGFDMFKNAKKIMSYPVSYFELIQNFILKHPLLEIEINNNYNVIM